VVKRQAADADSLHSLGLSTDSELVTSIRQCVVRLASHNSVVSSVQSLAQSLLSSCWPILLPTTEERVAALSALLTLIASNGIIIIFFFIYYLLLLLLLLLLFFVYCYYYYCCCCYFMISWV